MKKLIFIISFFSYSLELIAQKPVPVKPRILISTDIGGTDPDDNQSRYEIIRAGVWDDNSFCIICIFWFHIIRWKSYSLKENAQLDCFRIEVKLKENRRQMLQKQIYVACNPPY